MNRRQLLSIGSVAIAGSALVPSLFSPVNAQTRRPTIVLVHGAWHGSWCWSRIVELLANAGYQSVAIDLPGHGVGARFPAGYFDVPQDVAKLATAPSPLATLDVDAYRTHVTTLIERIAADGGGPVVLVGHSLGGVTLNSVGETSAALVRRLVYLTALSPVAKAAAGAYFSEPAMSTSKALPLFIGDPQKTGAIRFNARSPDASFRSAAKAAFYGDVSDDEFAAVANLLTPDEPAAVFGGAAKVTAERWGRIPRTYIRCTEDQALPIAAQDQFIAEGDALTPSNKYSVRTLRSSHSPFISMPQELAKLIIEATS